MAAAEGGDNMKISAKAGGQVFEVTVERQDSLFVVEVDGERHLVDAHKLEGDFYSIIFGGRSLEVSVEARRDAYSVRRGAVEKLVTLFDPGRQARDDLAAAGPEKVISAMPGRVVRVLVQEGDAVTAGQGLVVVEAMKMENEITAQKDGTVASIAVEAGQTVETGDLLLVVE